MNEVNSLYPKDIVFSYGNKDLKDLWWKIHYLGKTKMSSHRDNVLVQINDRGNVLIFGPRKEKFYAFMRKEMNMEKFPDEKELTEIIKMDRRNFMEEELEKSLKNNKLESGEKTTVEDSTIDDKVVYSFGNSELKSMNESEHILLGDSYLNKIRIEVVGEEKLEVKIWGMRAHILQEKLDQKHKIMDSYPLEPLKMSFIKDTVSEDMDDYYSEKYNLDSSKKECQAEGIESEGNLLIELKSQNKVLRRQNRKLEAAMCALKGMPGVKKGISSATKFSKSWTNHLKVINGVDTLVLDEGVNTLVMDEKGNKV